MSDFRLLHRLAELWYVYILSTYISIYLPLFHPGKQFQASRKKHARDKRLHFDLDNLVLQEAKAAKVGL